jgi:hypothetical protein
MTDLEYLQHVMDNVEDPEGDHEPSFMTMWLLLRDDFGLTDERLIPEDIRYIKNGMVFAEWVIEDNCLIEESDPWYWHIAKIVKGEYPLELIPEHVRNIARQLYYEA